MSDPRISNRPPSAPRRDRPPSDRGFRRSHRFWMVLGVAGAAVLGGVHPLWQGGTGRSLAQETAAPSAIEGDNRLLEAKLLGLGAETGEFHGFREYRFVLDQVACRVVVPAAEPASGRPWIWRARFWGHEPQTDVALLRLGYHVAYCDVAGLFGSPEAVARWNRFHRFATETLGFSEKPALEGMSRGGLIVFNWAFANPDKVACIYADAPVCTLLSWPLGTVAPEHPVFRELLAAYGAEDVEGFRASPPPMPADAETLRPLAERRVPILLVCGLDDEVVPYADNGSLLAARYRVLEGPVEVIEKPGVGHHPHSLQDPEPIVRFIRQHTNPTKTTTRPPTD